MQILAVQLDMVWESKAANHRRVQALLDETTIRPDSLIVLPEMFDTGFSMNVTKTAQTADRESETFLKQIAATSQCAVIGGVTGPLRGEQSTNQAVAFAPDGTELVRYQKMQPFTLTGEDTLYPAGTTHHTFEWQGVRIAPFICYDLRFPEIFRPAALAGAELLLVIACWPTARSEHWVRLLQARAIENQAYAIGVNRCGTDPHCVYDGRTSGFDPMGISLGEANAEQQVCCFEIDRQSTIRWREKFPALRDIRHLRA